jgi:hypothetical protein
MSHRGKWFELHLGHRFTDTDDSFQLNIHFMVDYKRKLVYSKYNIKALIDNDKSMILENTRKTIFRLKIKKKKKLKS